MAALTISNLKVETEGDLQVLYFTVASATDADTINVSKFFKAPIREISLRSSTKTQFGATHSAGVITLKSDTTSTAGAATLICRVAGGA